MISTGSVSQILYLPKGRIEPFRIGLILLLVREARLLHRLLKSAVEITLISCREDIGALQKPHQLSRPRSRHAIFAALAVRNRLRQRSVHLGSINHAQSSNQLDTLYIALDTWSSAYHG